MPIERRGPPDDLNHLGVELRGELFDGLLRGHVARFPRLNFHEFVRAQRVVDGLRDGRRDPVVSDVHERLEMVRFGAQRGALLAREAHCGAPAFAKYPNGFNGGPSHHWRVCSMRMT